MMQIVLWLLTIVLLGITVECTEDDDEYPCPFGCTCGNGKVYCWGTNQRRRVPVIENGWVRYRELDNAETADLLEYDLEDDTNSTVFGNFSIKETWLNVVNATEMQIAEVKELIERAKTLDFVPAIAEITQFIKSKWRKVAWIPWDEWFGKLGTIISEQSEKYKPDAFREPTTSAVLRRILFGTKGKKVQGETVDPK